MQNIKDSVVYFWQQLSPALRWFVLASFGIGYVVVAVAAGPLTALFAVIVGTVAILGILAALFVALIVLFGVPLYLAVQGLSLLQSQRWWLGGLFLAAAYAWTKLPLRCNGAAHGDVWLYTAAGLGWCVILSILYFYPAPRHRA